MNTFDKRVSCQDNKFLSYLSITEKAKVTRDILGTASEPSEKLNSLFPSLWKQGERRDSGGTLGTASKPSEKLNSLFPSWWKQGELRDSGAILNSIVGL